MIKNISIALAVMCALTSCSKSDRAPQSIANATTITVSNPSGIKHVICTDPCCGNPLCTGGGGDDDDDGGGSGGGFGGGLATTSCGPQAWCPGQTNAECAAPCGFAASAACVGVHENGTVVYACYR